MGSRYGAAHPPGCGVGGCCLPSHLFNPFPFLCARCFLLSKSGERFPSPHPTSPPAPRPPGPPTHNHWGHQPGRTPTRHPLPLSSRCCWAEEAAQPPSHGYADPMGHPGCLWGRVGGGTPGRLGPFPAPKGPRGARGRVPRSPSWLTHSPHCSCEVPRQHGSGWEHPEFWGGGQRSRDPHPHRLPARSGEDTGLGSLHATVRVRVGPVRPHGAVGLAGAVGPAVRCQGDPQPLFPSRRAGGTAARSARGANPTPPSPLSLSPTPRGRRGRNGARLRALT